MQIALLVEAVGLLIERATFLIPGKLVSQEGGKALILGMLGYPPGIGFVVGFLRRIKEMVWVLFGLLALMIHRMVVQQRGDMKEPRRRARLCNENATSTRRAIAMRKLTALVAGMTLAMTALPAAAGVVITQKQHVSKRHQLARLRTNDFGAGQQAEDGDRAHTIITDLDNGKMYVLDPKAKTYFEIEFPPKGADGDDDGGEHATRR